MQINQFWLASKLKSMLPFQHARICDIGYCTQVQGYVWLCSLTPHLITPLLLLLRFGVFFTPVGFQLDAHTIKKITQMLDSSPLRSHSLKQCHATPLICCASVGSKSLSSSAPHHLVLQLLTRRNRGRLQRLLLRCRLQERDARPKGDGRIGWIEV